MDRLTYQGQCFARMAAAMYADRCTIRRVTKSKAADMGDLVDDEILAIDIPCRLRIASANEMAFAGGLEGNVAFTVRLPAWKDDAVLTLDSNCFLDIAARGEVEAHTLAVVAPLPYSGLLLEAVTERRT